MNREAMEALLARVPARSLPSTLFNVAHAYARAADSCWERLDDSSDADFAAPAILCQAFAVELLLKFFIVRERGKQTTMSDLQAEGVNLRGHSYSSLFDKLTPTTQAKLAASYSSLAGTVVDATGFRSILVNLGDDPFVSWRYPYEDNAFKHLDKPLFDRVTDSLGKAAEVERKAST